MAVEIKLKQSFKNLFFNFLDFYVNIFRLNTRNNLIDKRDKVIWLAETGSRDFLPRFAQAISLWNEYQIPSLIIHKHYLKKIDKKILKNSVVIDKSATLSCIRRLRYSKLNGAVNFVIPEELLLCDNSQSLIEGSLHPKTLNYVDYVLSTSESVSKYLRNIKKGITLIKSINPRLNTILIWKNCKSILMNNNKFDNLLNQKYILINDKLSLKFSTYKNEISLLRNDIFKSTSIDSDKYVNDFLEEEENKEFLLIELIKSIRKQKEFDDLKIVIRPHPAVDLKKFELYFKKKLKNYHNYIIIRDGTAIEWMDNAEIIFHNNCTTAIEGYYGGLKNIFNIASNYSEGITNEFKHILIPLGVEGAVYSARERYIKYKKNIPRDLLKINQNENNLYHFLGKKMKKFNDKNIIDYKLESKFKSSYFKDFSIKDRWQDAENRIDFIKKNKVIFNDLLIRSIGKVGLSVGLFSN